MLDTHNIILKVPIVVFRHIDTKKRRGFIEMVLDYHWILLCILEDICNERYKNIEYESNIAGDKYNEYLGLCNLLHRNPVTDKRAKEIQKELVNNPCFTLIKFTTLVKASEEELSVLLAYWAILSVYGSRKGGIMITNWELIIARMNGYKSNKEMEGAKPNTYTQKLCGNSFLYHRKNLTQKLWGGFGVYLKGERGIHGLYLAITSKDRGKKNEQLQKIREDIKADMGKRKKNKLSDDIKRLEERGQ